jgi:hypothetical protein
LAALLTACQLGFRSLALQKRSSEVWQLLGAIKTEFDRYEIWPSRTQRWVSPRSFSVAQRRPRLMSRWLCVLSPRDTNSFVRIGIVGSAKLHLGADEEAVTWLRRSNEANRNHPIAHFYLAAALARLGRLDEARDAMHAGLALNPGSRDNALVKDASALAKCAARSSVRKLMAI